MTTNYKSGTRVERSIVAFLKSKGYTVLRSAGSKGAIDIVAYNSVRVRFIQAKTTKRDYVSYTKELGELKALEVPDCVEKEFWAHKHRKGYTIYTTAMKLEYPEGASIYGLHRIC